MVGDIVRYCSFNELRSALLEDISQLSKEDFESGYKGKTIEERTYNFLIEYWNALVMDEILYLIVVKDGRYYELRDEDSFARFMFECALKIVREYLYE